MAHYPMLLPEERLLRLMHALTPDELAEVTILVSDLALQLTQDQEQGNYLLNCVAAQIADHLSDTDAETFRALLAAGGDCRDAPDA